ncbi:MAG: hypothetical protein JNG89_16785 [Planctomycetaceae bacterium]|nr:hypothetical protein [Planctomycetaceae bacterium]
MIPAAVDLQAERWELAKLAAAILQPALLIALAAGLVLAAAHLLTMLGTRWGRRRVSQKALLFSCVLHFSFICGILALWPEAVPGSLYALRRRSNEPPIPPPEAFLIRSEPELVESRPDGSVTSPQAVWNQLPDDLVAPSERSSIEPQTLDAPPVVRPEAALPPERELAVITPLPFPELDVPQPAPADPEAQPATPAPADLLSPDVPSVTETRDESSPPELSRERSDASPQAIADAGSVESASRPDPAPVDRISPRPSEEPPTGVSGEFDEQATLRPLDEGEEIIRPEGPVPATIPSADSEPSLADAGPTTPETPLRPAPTRDRSDAPGDRPETPVAPSDIDSERPRPAFAAPDRRRPRSSESPDDSIARTEIPTLERPQLGGIPEGDGTSSVPAPYRLRGDAEREEATKRFGGNAESERAVELSLQWLADNQVVDGYWDASAHGAGDTRIEGMQSFNDVGKDADTGLSALALLAFLGRGHTLDEGEYRDTVERGLRWIVSRQREDGGLGGSAGATDYAYCHAMSTFALAEAYALSDKSSADWLRLPVQRAVQHTLDTMTTDGGWRYYKEKDPSEGDMSIFGWQLMALKSAELGGITIPKTVQDKMVRFLVSRSLGTSGGLAGYRRGERPTPSMTAEALYCKQRLGISRENPACAEAVSFLQRSLPQRTQMNFYYWYYGSLAMRQYGGDEWTQWNDRLRDLLIQEQRQDGALAGSWDPDAAWGRYGGRLYSTALATLCLEVYYRYGEQE